MDFIYNSPLRSKLTAWDKIVTITTGTDSLNRGTSHSPRCSMVTIHDIVLLPEIGIGSIYIFTCAITARCLVINHAEASPIIPDLLHWHNGAADIRVLTDLNSMVLATFVIWLPMEIQIRSRALFEVASRGGGTLLFFELLARQRWDLDSTNSIYSTFTLGNIFTGII